MKMLIAYDGSDEAKKAVEAMAGADLPRQAEVLVVAPVDVWPHLPPSSFRPIAERERPMLHMAHELAHLALSDALATARQGAQQLQRLFPDWIVHCEASVEPLPAGLLRKADEWGADRLFISDKELHRHRAYSTWHSRHGDLPYAG